MFLHLCVILLGGWGVSVPACTTGDMTRGSVQGGGVCPGCLYPGRGVSVQGGGLSWEGGLSGGGAPFGGGGAKPTQ